MQYHIDLINYYFTWCLHDVVFFFALKIVSLCGINDSRSVSLLFVLHWCKTANVFPSNIFETTLSYSAHIIKRKRKGGQIRITSLLFLYPIFFFLAEKKNPTQRETKICKKNKIQNSFVVSKSTWKVCWLVTFYIQTCQLHNPL